MSTFKKRLIVTLLGVAAGLAAWPVVEVILSRQAAFPSYLVFNIVFGCLFGVILGMFFGSGEGLICSDWSRSATGALTGAVVGLCGGALGFLAGQAALFLFGGILFRSYATFRTIGLPLSRALGWACMGIIIGMTEGIRARASKKILMGILGGLLGGLLGGFSIEYLKLFFPGLIYARLAGLVLFGALIGLFYSIIEKQMSFGILQVLRGKFKGKEFFINQNRITIGGDARSDIFLPGCDLAAKHALIEVKHHDVIIRKADKAAPLQVNEKEIDNRILKYEDVIKIGRVKLFYKQG